MTSSRRERAGRARSLLVGAPPRIQTCARPRNRARPPTRSRLPSRVPADVRRRRLTSRASEPRQRLGIPAPRYTCASVYPGVSKACPSPLSAVESKSENRGLTRHFSLWGRLDSNQRPTDYESAVTHSAASSLSLTTYASTGLTASAKSTQGSELSPQVARLDRPRVPASIPAVSKQEGVGRETGIRS
jgi:hypothetical protein